MNEHTDDKQGIKGILKQKTNYLIAAAILVIIVIFLGSGSEQDSMLTAQSDHHHEKAMLIAYKLLKQNPNDSTAKAVIKQSGQLFAYLQEAKLTFDQSLATDEKITDNPETFLIGLQKVRVPIEKAKAIDPKAERLLAFESTLDETESQLRYMLTMQAISSGQAVIAEVSSKYQKTTEIIEAAESSSYLAQFMTFQSSGATIGKPVEEVKESIKPHLQKMQKTQQLIVSSGNKDEALSESLTAYTSSVKSTTETLLAPQGSFKDYAVIAGKSMSEYKKSLKQLNRKLPKIDSFEASIAELVDDLSKHHVFHDHSIYQIMALNKSLFE